MTSGREPDIRDCNIFCLTETWLNSSMPDYEINPVESLSVFCSDVTAKSVKITSHHKWTTTRQYQTSMKCCAATKLNIQMPPSSWQGISIKPDWNRSCLTFTSIIICPTRGDNTLDHCYSLYKGGYKDNSLLAFGKSDHVTWEYKQRLLQKVPLTSEVRCWIAQSVAARRTQRCRLGRIQDYFCKHQRVLRHNDQF